MKIVVVKLVTGDEVIGSLVSGDEDHMSEEYIVLSKARTLVMQQAEGGQIGLGMMPFMPSADNPATDTESDIRIFKQFIVAEPTKVPVPLEEAYTRTTSNIVI
jgi:hypothetical protein